MKNSSAKARAIVRQVPIRLLDEPTCSLDLDSEAEITRALGRAAVGRTTLLITHRPGILELADRAVLLDGGRIVDECTPGEMRSRYADRFALLGTALPATMGETQIDPETGSTSEPLF